ncbi:hypothetical protein GQ457_02G020740 [Hibiscus cannabinus]
MALSRKQYVFLGVGSVAFGVFLLAVRFSTLGHSLSPWFRVRILYFAIAVVVVPALISLRKKWPAKAEDIFGRGTFLFRSFAQTSHNSSPEMPISAPDGVCRLDDENQRGGGENQRGGGENQRDGGENQDEVAENNIGETESNVEIDLENALGANSSPMVTPITNTVTSGENQDEVAENHSNETRLPDKNDIESGLGANSSPTITLITNTITSDENQDVVAENQSKETELPDENDLESRLGANSSPTITLVTNTIISDENQDVVAELPATTCELSSATAGGLHAATHAQDLSKLDVTKLHPLSPEVISQQATINIGIIGHLAHGKSTVKAISGVRFKNELERNITIKIGYANAKIYKYEDEQCPHPQCYKSYGSGKEDSPLCDVPGFENSMMKLLRHVSFVGHDILMATMLNGAAIMDGALLLISANESFPQPQTSEHLVALEIMRLQHIIVLQNNVDLIQENVAMNQYEAIQCFIQGTVVDGAPVVPISTQLKRNIDVVCEYIVKKIPIPERNFISPPKMIVIRSFDVNKLGFEVDEIRGGVAGGNILQGVLKVNQLIEVRPGIVVRDESGNIKCTPIYSRIVSLYTEQNELQFAVPGGLIGVGTTMDPTLTRADRLVGQVLGEVNLFLLRRLLGVWRKGSRRQVKVSKLVKAEILMLKIGSISTGARVIALKNDLAKLQLTSPVCTSKGEKIALSRRIEKHWCLIGF